MKRRLLTAAVILLVILLGAACDGQPEFKGTDLEGEPAPNFQLTDQHAEVVRLEDLRGKVVVLTFLYTSCPDVCPIIAQKLRKAHEQLGSAAQDVAIVAITVDPETDTVERVRQYSAAMGMEGNWHFLTGMREELTPIWKAYYVAPLPVKLSAELAAAPDLAEDDSRFGGAHTAPVFLIDQHSRWRLHHSGGDLSVEGLVHDIRLLLKQG